MPARGDESGLEAVVFDLDDTLFVEQQYVRSGFRHVARAAADEAGPLRDEIFDFLLKTAGERHGRGDVFNRLLARFPALARRWSVEDLVSLYRRHSPEVELRPGARELLQELREAGVRLGVITDGAPDSQRRKLEALRLLEIVDEAIVTGEFGIECHKPNPFAFQRIADALAVEHRACVYIGDNPAKDFAAGRRLGWSTVRLRMAGQFHEQAEAASPEFAPHAEADSIEALRDFLAARVSFRLQAER